MQASGFFVEQHDRRFARANHRDRFFNDEIADPFWIKHRADSVRNVINQIDFVIFFNQFLSQILQFIFGIGFFADPFGNDAQRALTIFMLRKFRRKAAHADDIAVKLALRQQRRRRDARRLRRRAFQRHALQIMINHKMPPRAALPLEFR